MNDEQFTLEIEEALKNFWWASYGGKVPSMVRPFVIAMCDNFYRAGAEAAKNLLERQLLDDGK